MPAFAHLLAQFRQDLPPSLTSAAETEAVTQPDPANEALNRQIDAFCDQLRAGSVQNALAGFRALLQTVPAAVSGKNIFRLKANIGHCLQQLGDEAAAAASFLEAFDHAPVEPKAIAHKALAFLLRGEPQAAYDYALVTLAQQPENEWLASYAVQAAAQLPAITDPLNGIAPGLRERREVMLAEAFFYQRRNQCAEWIERARRAAQRYPEDEAVALMAAQAEIHAYLSSGSFITTFQIANSDKQTLSTAAELLQAHWERRQATGTPPLLSSVILAVDAVIGWHLAHEARKAIALAEQIIVLAIRNRTVMVNIGQVLAANDQHEAAQRAFALVPESPEARWVRALDAVQANNWSMAASILAEGDIPEEEAPLAATFRSLATLLARPVPADPEQFQALIEPARGDIRALIAVARGAKDHGFAGVATSAFEAALGEVTLNTPKEARLVAASYARSDDKPTALIDLLTPIIPHDEPSDALIWLAEAHADETPRKQRNKAFFERLPQRLKSQPAYASRYVTYLLNAGASELDEAITILKDLREAEPARVDHVIRLAMAYRRKNDMQQFEALTQSLDLTVLQPSPLNRALLAQILRDGGRPTDAVREGFAALRAAPDNAKVALAYVGLLIGSENRILLPDHTRVAEGTFVKLTGPHDEQRSFFIDRGTSFYGIDVRAPDQTFVQQLLGKAIGETITMPKPVGPAETWVITEVKDKFLHALHVVMEDFEQRFGDHDGLSRITVDPENLTPILDHIRDYAEAKREQARVYTEQHLPLEFAARMMGGHVLDFAGYINQIGGNIFTCVGTEPERREAAALVQASAGTGAVLDSYTACLAAGLNLLPVLKAQFGRLVVASATIDMLDELLLRQRENRGRESMTIAWINGQHIRHMITDTEIEAIIVEYERVKSAIMTHAAVLPGHFPDDASPETAALAARIGEEPYFPIFLAAEHGMVFLSEDYPTRLFANLITRVKATWLQPVLTAAKNSGSLDATAYATALAGLADQRHSSIAITVQDLLLLYRADGDHKLLLFKKLALALGGANADFVSHVRVAAFTIRKIFCPHSLRSQAATSTILYNLIRGRDDYGDMLGCLAVLLSNDPAFTDYLSGWISGHFLPVEPIASAYHDYDRQLRVRFPAPLGIFGHRHSYSKMHSASRDGANG